MLEIASEIWPIVFAIFAFVGGKIFGQSEKVLDQKRNAYAKFLELCPAPNEAHFDMPPDWLELQRAIGVLTIYGSPEALKNAGEYFTNFGVAQETLQGVDEAGHPEFLRLMTIYNKMAWSMRVDAMTWSIFAPTKNNREYRPSIDVGN